MNPDIPGSDGSYLYYDSDYPWPEEMEADPALRMAAARQGILHDVPHYLRLARDLASMLGRAPRITELACGTGRLSVPLARAGFAVQGVDASPAMLEGLRQRLEREDAATVSLLHVHEGDLRQLDLPEKAQDLIIMGFNILMLIADFQAQQDVLARACAHLAPGGWLALDVANPLMLSLGASATPDASYTRRNRRTGNLYTKFAMVGQLDERQVQHVHGWYDEVVPGGAVRRTHYGFHWRPVFRFELELMLRQAGFDLERVDGDFQGGPFDTGAPKMVVLARRRA
ncbi:class I SAM-dependent methyltransferase [Niveispirillum fermenti]|uniref:class I SAM-dependent methyltransferase n=1 Tax=Niveispirillum fermenti TaxID=1233113 RepID=UPI003A8C6192